jgi:WD40 repeat protein
LKDNSTVKFWVRPREESASPVAVARFVARSVHTATLLPNGKVLVVGRYNYEGGGDLNSAELYDPATGTWSITGSLNTPRAYHTATLLQNGKVLVAGGFNAFPRNIALNSAELYDPATGTWSVTGSLNTARSSPTASLLANGKVLVAGGFTGLSTGGLCPCIAFVTNSTELYDPGTGIWSVTGGLNAERGLHTATLLPNGKVLAAGGTNGTLIDAGEYVPLTSAELYDPTTGIWGSTGSLNTARYTHTATLLPNGKVLAATGIYTGTAELYDPATGIWSFTANLETGVHTATLLSNGKVLVAGGYDVRQGRIQRLNSAELYESPEVGITVSPSSGSGSFQIFSFGFFDPNGSANIFSTQVLIHSSPEISVKRRRVLP